MNLNNLDKVRQYQNAIRDALLKEWDPIGINAIAEAQDEYDAYVWTVYKLLIEGKQKNDILDYLWWLETEHMGLTGDRQATERFAERLLRLRADLERE